MFSSQSCRAQIENSQFTNAWDLSEEKQIMQCKVCYIEPPHRWKEIVCCVSPKTQCGLNA